MSFRHLAISAQSSRLSKLGFPPEQATAATLNSAIYLDQEEHWFDR